MGNVFLGGLDLCAQEFRETLRLESDCNYVCNVICNASNRHSDAVCLLSYTLTYTPKVTTTRYIVIFIFEQDQRL